MCIITTDLSFSVFSFVGFHAVDFSLQHATHFSVKFPIFFDKLTFVASVTLTFTPTAMIFLGLMEKYVSLYPVKLCHSLLICITCYILKVMYGAENLFFFKMAPVTLTLEQIEKN